MPITQLITLFLGWCAEHRSAETARHYRARLASFVAQVGQRELQSLNALEVEAWLTSAGRFDDGRRKSNSTRRANVVAWQRFQQWALERDAIAKPITKKLEKPAVGERSRLPTPAEIAAITEHASPQFRLIYSALRNSGARPGELCNARIDNIQDGMIVLSRHKTFRKTGKPRRIAIGQRLQRLIDVAIGGRPDGKIFLSPRGRPWTVQGLSKTFLRLRRKAGLPDDLCLYLARHEHATKVCDKLGIKAAADALGHVSLETTKRYVKTDDEKLRGIQDAIDE